MPGFGYVVRHKGALEVGALTSCASCHTRVLPGGSVVKGAQGNLPFDQILVSGLQQADAVPEGVVPLVLNAEWSFFGAPWVVTREEFDRVTTLQELVRRHTAIQPGYFVVAHGLKLLGGVMGGLIAGRRNIRLAAAPEATPS